MSAFLDDGVQGVEMVLQRQLLFLDPARGLARLHRPAQRGDQIIPVDRLLDEVAGAAAQRGRAPRMRLPPWVRVRRPRVARRAGARARPRPPPARRRSTPGPPAGPSPGDSARALESRDTTPPRSNRGRSASG